MTTPSTRSAVPAALLWASRPDKLNVPGVRRSRSLPARGIQVKDQLVQSVALDAEI
jgi:hypothetical protein